ncbi:MAG: HD-GYP domain-containing protein [Actinobacteria bacterium]|nr:MAG: HD-GYP domain-containing protein [Actinomycetota bacterium]
MDVEVLVGEARERELQPMPARERIVAGATAIAFLCAAGVAAAVIPPNRSFEPLTCIGLVALLCVARRVTFEIGNNFATSDQLAFIPMLFLAPIEVVPLLAACGYILARLPDFVRGQAHTDRWLYTLGDAWHSIGAVAVIAALAPGPPTAAHLPVYVLALLGQVGVMAALAVTTDYLVHRTSPLEAMWLAIWACRIDALLTPIAYMVAAVGERQPAAVLAVAPVLALLQVFSSERRDRIAAALELNQAYRGTVMVLSDVVEAEDNYTASHCRSVVELASAVADDLGLSSTTKQELEIAALLHDVGKIAIPNEILNKPAKLTDVEFDLMKTHTVEGQALLDRVGGRLARVGEIVRSCHERWDGRGYPDGLAGDEIPVAARIVFCCDAYSAMTTDRPYRRAMTMDGALQELRENSGTQFEPRVVESLERVVHSLDPSVDAPYADALRAVLIGSAASLAPAELPA